MWSKNLEPEFITKNIYKCWRVKHHYFTAVELVRVSWLLLLGHLFISVLRGNLIKSSDDPLTCAFPFSRDDDIIDLRFHFQFPRIIANLRCLSDVVCLPGLLRRLLSPSSSCGSIGESLPGSQSTSPASLSPCPLSLVLCQSEQSWPPYLQTNVNLTHKLSVHVSV